MHQYNSKTKQHYLLTNAVQISVRLFKKHREHNCGLCWIQCGCLWDPLEQTQRQDEPGLTDATTTVQPHCFLLFSSRLTLSKYLEECSE